MSKQLHKNFTDEKVKLLLKTNASKEIKIKGKILKKRSIFEKFVEIIKYIRFDIIMYIFNLSNIVLTAFSGLVSLFLVLDIQYRLCLCFWVKLSIILIK